MLKYQHGGTWSPGGYKNFYHIHTWPKKDNPNELISRSNVQDCREYYCKWYRTTINKGDAYAPGTLKAFALIAYGYPRSDWFGAWKNELETASAKGLYIMNSFEKAHGWPLTKMHSVKCTNEGIPFVFFAGPRKWTTSPYLMSIWSLLLRVGRCTWLPKHLMKLNHENLVRQLAISAKSTNNADAKQVSATIREWDPFMTLYKELFGGKPRSYHWLKSHLNGANDRPEGIQRLMKGSTGYKALYRKYYKLKEAQKLK